MDPSKSPFTATSGGVQPTTCSIIHISYTRYFGMDLLRIRHWHMIHSPSTCSSSLLTPSMDILQQFSTMDESWRRFLRAPFNFTMQTRNRWRMLWCFEGFKALQHHFLSETLLILWHVLPAVEELQTVVGGETQWWWFWNPLWCNQ